MNAVTRWYSLNKYKKIYGVLEGGGVKGVAYQGAFKALEEKDYWFKSITGPSVGAISASLVAMGLKPTEMKEPLNDALETLKTEWNTWESKGIFGQVKQLHKTGQILPREGLLNWLDEFLKIQVRDSNEGKPVTFLDLFEYSEIELNVVAVDLSLRLPIVFSYQTTPDIFVADAVIASASIPFVFESGKLATELKEGSIPYFRTIADGGILTNFPMFVYEDSKFRKYNGINPEVINKDEVYGFLLHEIEESKGIRVLRQAFINEKSHFVKEDDKCLPIEMIFDKVKRFCLKQSEEVQVEKSQQGNQKNEPITFVVRILKLISDFMDWCHSKANPYDVLRVPVYSKNSAKNYLLNIFDTTLTLLRGDLLAKVCLVFFWFLQFVVLIVSVWIVFNVVSSMNTGSWFGQTTMLFFIFFSYLIVAVTIVLFFGLPMVMNWALAKPARQVGYGLVKTFLTASDAPPWELLRERVIKLPIKYGVNTLSFNEIGKHQEKIIEDARNATKDFKFI